MLFTLRIYHTSFKNMGDDYLILADNEKDLERIVLESFMKTFNCDEVHFEQTDPIRSEKIVKAYRYDEQIKWEGLIMKANPITKPIRL